MCTVQERPVERLKKILIERVSRAEPSWAEADPKSDRCQERSPTLFSPPRSRSGSAQPHTRKAFLPPLHLASRNYHARRILGKKKPFLVPLNRRRRLHRGTLSRVALRSSFSLLLNPLVEIDLISPVLVNPSALPLPSFFFFAVIRCDVNHWSESLTYFGPFGLFLGCPVCGFVRCSELSPPWPFSSWGHTRSQWGS